MDSHDVAKDWSQRETRIMVFRLMTLTLWVDSLTWFDFGVVPIHEGVKCQNDDLPQGEYAKDP